MKWIIEGRWQHNQTKKVYRAKAFAITSGKEDPVQVLHDEVDFSGMTYLGGVVRRDDEAKAGFISPLVSEE